MTKGTGYQAQLITPKCDQLAAINRLTSNVGGRFGCFTELPWNSVEWGKAKRVDIRLGQKRDSDVFIVDDGVGMNAERRLRFLSLAVTADKAHRGRNYQDIGAKRAAHDFAQCEVWTVCAEEKDGEGRPVCWHLDFSWDKLFEILAGRSQETIAATPVQRPPKLWQELGLKESWTGTIIKLSGLREGRTRFNPETIRKRLAAELPIGVAGKIFINNEPLPAREVVGTPLHFEMAHPILGAVRADLYIPKTSSSADELRVGPYEKVSTWSDFVREVPEELDLDRLAILQMGGVFGDIHVEALSRFVATSRREFDPELFSVHNQVLVETLNWLAHDVVPEVERLVGVIRDEAELAEDRDTTERLRDLVKALSGGDVDVVTKVPPLELDLSQLELLSGAHATVRVVKSDPDQQLVWNHSNAGGSAKLSDGNRQLELVAGNTVGTYSAYCYYREYPDHQVGVRIDIVAKKQLRIEPAQLTLGPTRTVTLRAVNHEDDSSGAANLRWRLEPQDRGGFLVPIGDSVQRREVGFGPDVRYQAGDVEGSFVVEVYDQKSRTKTARCQVTVAKSKGGGSRPKDKDVIVIGGIPYILSPHKMPGSPVLTRLISRADANEIILNYAHATCVRTQKAMGRDAMLVLLVNRIILHHMARLSESNGGEITPSALTDQHAALLSAVADGIATPTTN